MAYAIALFTGLRRGEIKSLLWVDMHLDGVRPFIAVRASTTKNKKTAQQPLLPSLVSSLKALRDQQQAPTGKVFRLGVPSPKMLRRDLATCGIPFLDETGRRVDFHALRHTFNTMLQRAGLPQRVITELMRQSDPRLSTITYTDVTCLPVFDELGKLAPFLPSPIASPKPDKSGLNEGKVVQSGLVVVAEEMPFLAGKPVILSTVVQTCPIVKVAEREGFEPPEPCGSPHFECGAIDHSATSP